MVKRPFAAAGFCLAMFLVAAGACRTAAGEPLDESLTVREIQLRTEYPDAGGGGADAGFDVLSVLEDGSACVLRYWAGRKHRKAIWREEVVDLAGDECAGVQLWVDEESLDAFSSSTPGRAPAAGLHYQLVVRWSEEASSPGSHPPRTSRTDWVGAVDQEEYPKIHGLVEALQALKTRFTQERKAPRPIAQAEEVEREEAAPAAPSGIRGHVSHPGGVPWDSRQVYPLSVIVLDENRVELRSIETDENGNYRVELPPGRYTLCPGSCTNLILKRQSKTVLVEAGKMASVDLHFDSGIR